MVAFIVKWPGIVLKQFVNKNTAVLICLAVIMCCFFTPMVFGSSGGEHEPKGWIATDTYRVMNFAVLAVGLIFLLRKPVAEGLNLRIDDIKNSLSELEAKKKDAKEQLDKYNKILSGLDNEAEKIIAEYVKQGEEAKGRILKEAEATAVKLEEQAHKNIEHEFKQAKLRLKEDIIEKALAKAEEIIKDKITDKDQDRLVDEFLEKVVA